MLRRAISTSLCILVILTGRPSHAQEGDTARGPRDIQVSLTQSLGPAYGALCDQGVSPRIYHAPGLAADWSAVIENNLWRYTAQVQISGGLLCKSIFPLKSMTTSGADVQAILHIGLERSLSAQPSWQLWVGAAIEDRLAIDYNNRYMNACVGLGNLAAPTLWVKEEYHRGRCTLWIAAGSAPLGWWFRPGFSYMDNYSSGETEIESFGNGYEWNCTPLPHLLGELGVTWQLTNGNALGIAYDWHYLTTRNSGHWMYEGATHSLKLTLTFKL